MICTQVKDIEVGTLEQGRSMRDAPHLKLSLSSGPLQVDMKSETIFSSLRNLIDALVGASTSSYRKLIMARVWNYGTKTVKVIVNDYFNPPYYPHWETFSLAFLRIYLD